MLFHKESLQSSESEQLFDKHQKKLCSHHKHEKMKPQHRK